MRPTDLPDAVGLAFDKTALHSDGRRDPLFAAAPKFVEAGPTTRLDPMRIELAPEPRPARRRSAEGPIGSLLLHLLPLLTLIAWLRPPLEMPAPIPVQLVIEQAKPPPPPEPKQADKPPQGRFASDDVAENQGAKTENGAGNTPTAAGELAPPTETRAAQPSPGEPAKQELQAPTETRTAEAEPSQPAPPAEPSKQAPRPPGEAQAAAPTPPQPAPAAEQSRQEPRPKPTPPKRQAMARAPEMLSGSWPLPLQPNGAQRSAALIGPNATRDEYCAYALALTLQHLDLLPASLVGSRRGATVLSIRVLEDGTIRNVSVTRSSGYPDIDVRVEQMVRAVGKFPPLPQWLPGPWMDFRFQLHFPHS